MSLHWKRLARPIALNLNVAVRLRDLIFALVILVCGGLSVKAADEPMVTNTRAGSRSMPSVLR